MQTIDLNADLGEGYGSDEEILALVSSASMACGAHAGDALTVRKALEGALRRGVSVGAHPGYADRAEFGRVETGASPLEIRGLVLAQLEAFTAACVDAGATCRHVKPHGALYNRAMREPAAAESIARAVAEFDPSLAVLCMPGSRLHQAAEAAGLRAVREAFLDRAYASPEALVPRSNPRALIDDPAAAAARAARMVLDGALTSIDGADHRLEADSLCVHGDNPRAAAILRAVRARLERAAVEIAPFHAE
ncbi:MAG: LamB/YcsF family protein [Gemmatimonadaceae bacterium]